MPSNSRQSIFKPGQIVCLESKNGFLYGEVIQVVIKRELCWVRPLTVAIVTDVNNYSYDFNSYKDIIDLRSASDLLLPLTLFRASYDTEVISLLAELASKEESFDNQQMSLYLNHFVKQVWKDNQDKFK